MKKVLSLIFSIALVLSLANVCFAATADKAPAENSSQNYNVTTVCPWEGISTRGVNPPTEAWNIQNGPYEFSGQASYSTLYLNRLIYGWTAFDVTVKNLSSSNTLTVNPHDSEELTPFKVAPKTTALKTFNLQLDKNYFCLSFNAPSYFEGKVTMHIYQ